MLSASDDVKCTHCQSLGRAQHTRVFCSRREGEVRKTLINAFLSVVKHKTKKPKPLPRSRESLTRVIYSEVYFVFPLRTRSDDEMDWKMSLINVQVLRNSKRNNFNKFQHSSQFPLTTQDLSELSLVADMCSLILTHEMTESRCVLRIEMLKITQYSVVCIVWKFSGAYRESVISVHLSYLA